MRGKNLWSNLVGSLGRIAPTITKGGAYHAPLNQIVEYGPQEKRGKKWRRKKRRIETQPDEGLWPEGYIAPGKVSADARRQMALQRPTGLS